jgi:hypothetical protein
VKLVLIRVEKTLSGCQSSNAELQSRPYAV